MKKASVEKKSSGIINSVIPPVDKRYIVVKKSGVHGKGVYAKCDIPKDTRIIEYVGEKVTKAESDRRAKKALEKHAKDGNGSIYIYTLNKRYDIDGYVTGNPARYVNHSCEPNCRSDVIRGRIWIIALRDIKKGEELNFDYEYEVRQDWQDHPCYCGDKKCFGYIVARYYRPILKRKIAAKMKADKKNV